MVGESLREHKPLEALSIMLKHLGGEVHYKNLLAGSFNPLVNHIYFIQKDKSEFTGIDTLLEWNQEQDENIDFSMDYYTFCR